MRLYGRLHSGCGDRITQMQQSVALAIYYLKFIEIYRVPNLIYCNKKNSPVDLTANFSGKPEIACCPLKYGVSVRRLWAGCQSWTHYSTFLHPERESGCRSVLRRSPAPLLHSIEPEFPLTYGKQV